MEFKEFTNPEEKDYDINMSLNSVGNTTQVNPYVVKLCDLIGILEDISEEELQKQFGISMNEYLNPTAETIDKVSQKLVARSR